MPIKRLRSTAPRADLQAPVLLARESEVVVAIIANAILQEKSVLFASRNNGAISVVQERVEKVLGQGSGFFRLGSDAKSHVRALLNQLTRNELPEKKSELRAEDAAYTDLENVFTTILNHENATEEARQAEKSYEEALAALELNEETLPNSFEAELRNSLKASFHKFRKRSGSKAPLNRRQALSRQAG